MPTYIVVRHGSNAANQPMCNRAVLGLVTATTADKAVVTAHKRPWTVYNNQYLQVVPISKATKRDREEAEELDRQANEIVQASCCLCGKLLGDMAREDATWPRCNQCKDE